MQEHWSIEQYNEYKKKGNKKSKYGAVKTQIDGHTFDSKKEADYYMELKMRLLAGEIRGYCLQPIFILAANLKYKADFIVFNNDGTSEVIDVKGFKTKEYIAKNGDLQDADTKRADKSLRTALECVEKVENEEKQTNDSNTKI